LRADCQVPNNIPPKDPHTIRGLTTGAFPKEAATIPTKQSNVPMLEHASNTENLTTPTENAYNKYPADSRTSAVRKRSPTIVTILLHFEF
jgi:hypothetical protein